MQRLACVRVRAQARFEPCLLPQMQMQRARSRVERLKCLECCQYKCKHLKHNFDACARPHGPKNTPRTAASKSEKTGFSFGFVELRARSGALRPAAKAPESPRRTVSVRRDLPRPNVTPVGSRRWRRRVVGASHVIRFLHWTLSNYPTGVRNGQPRPLTQCFSFCGSCRLC